MNKSDKQIIKPLFVLAPIAGVILFVFLYLIAASFYPGGSQWDKTSNGFSWTQNYWCNLLNETALNGMSNSARSFAVAAMFILMLTLSLFWYLFPLMTHFSQARRRIILISGVLSMATGALLASSYHDTVVIVASAFGLVALTSTLSGLKKLRWTRLLYFGFFILLLVLVNNILYYGPGLQQYLPVVQKCTFLAFLIWITLICIRMYTTMSREKNAERNSQKNSINMKWMFFLFVLSLFSCSQSEEKLSMAEIAQIKREIINRSEKHASDLENLDHKGVMTFYANTEDFIVFGDGYYWGDYLTMDGVWKEILGDGGWKKMLKWDLKNHKIYVFSKDAASYLVEFDHEHIGANGDTARSSGCFTYGMLKIDGEWKAVTAHVSHIPERTNEEKWWSKYSPENRKEKK